MDTNHQQQRSSRGGDRSVFKCATLVVQWRVWLTSSQVNTQSVAVLHLHIPCGGVHFNNLSVRLMISSMYRQQVLIGTHYMDCIVTTSAEITTANENAVAPLFAVQICTLDCKAVCYIVSFTCERIIFLWFTCKH